MKKVLVLFLSMALVLSICACGKEEPTTNDTAENTVVEETTKTEETEATEAVEQEKTSTEETVTEETGAEETATADSIPEIKGTSGGMDYELVGLDFTESYDNGSAIRFWFKVTKFNPKYPMEDNNAELLKDFEGSRTLEVSPWINTVDFMTVWSREVERVWIGEQTMAQACANTERDVNKIIERNIKNPNFLN